MYATTDVAKIDEDQQDYLNQYLNLAREENIENFQKEDTKSTLLTAKLVGISINKEKKFFQDLREILNKMTQADSITTHVLTLCLTNNPDSEYSVAREQCAVVIKQLIEKCCVEKKYLGVYFECLMDCCAGRLSAYFQSAEDDVLSELDAQFKDLVVNDDFSKLGTTIC